MANPPHTRAAMRAFYPVCQVAELAAGYGYTTKPKDFAEWLCRQALRQVPRTGHVRCTIDWTSEDHQPLLVVSLVVGRRALPIFWRAYDQTVLKGRMKRYEPM